MSKIKNGGLDQYGKVQSLNGIGGKSVNLSHSPTLSPPVTAKHRVVKFQQTFLHEMFSIRALDLFLGAMPICRYESPGVTGFL